MSAALEEADDDAVSLFEWSDAYSVGNAEMDAQHRKLLGLCEVAERCAPFDNSKGYETFHLVLNELFLYADSHFAAEEKLLAEYGYPDLETHKDEHERWLERVADLLVESLDGPPDCDRLRRFLRTWWQQHILGSDLRYREHLLNSASP